MLETQGEKASHAPLVVCQYDVLQHLQHAPVQPKQQRLDLVSRRALHHHLAITEESQMDLPSAK
eukprot:COSAG01_NODE_26562_length_709_cov_9509.121311_1_plen_63_part_10